MWISNGEGFEQRDSLENPSTDLIAALTSPNGFMQFGGSPIAGVYVNEDTALGFPSVYACVRVIAETIAALPFHLYRTVGRSRVQADDDPRAWLLNEEPNPEQDAMTFWEMVLGHVLLWGNGYIFKQTDPGTGITTALWPLMPNVTRPVRLPDNTLAYVTQLPTGEMRGLTADEVIHIRNFGTGKGDVGLSTIQLHRRSIGLGIAGDEYAARFFANDGRPGGFIQIDKPVNDVQKAEFKRHWDAYHKGLQNSHLMAILDDGKKWVDIGMPQGDVQFIESRKWQKREVASIFRVPPHKVGDAEPGAVSYASVEQFNLEFVSEVLTPWCSRVEGVIKLGMFGSEPDRAQGLYPKFQMNALLRPDTKTRFEAHKIAIDSGFMTVAEVRELEDLEYIEGTDELRPLLPAVVAPPPPEAE